MSLTPRRVLTASQRQAAMKSASREVDQEIKKAGGLRRWRAQQAKIAKTQETSESRPRALDRLSLGSWFQGGNG